MMGTVILPTLITVGFLYGIRLMQSPRTALWGNRLGALCMALAVALTFWRFNLLLNPLAWGCLLVGGGAGGVKAHWTKTIEMPQMVALLNGFGGAASALVIGACIGTVVNEMGAGVLLVSAIALAAGSLTFTGSVVAVLKLQGRLKQLPAFVEQAQRLIKPLLVAGVALLLLVALTGQPILFYVAIGLFALYGLLMAVRVGGADMPVLISFLNSLSGVAAALSGIALGNMLVAGVGALVGVAGLILTQIMCRAMNRNLKAVLGGFRTVAVVEGGAEVSETPAEEKGVGEKDIPALLRDAQTVIIIPGYGMALAQAQQAVKELMDALEGAGKEVKAAIHPVAGRMPGHMHVLLAEVGIDYDRLCDMAAINDAFVETDLVIAVGACDVINPAATTAEGTPIHGMPILRASEAAHVIVCNLDETPGYSGVKNTLYDAGHVITLWGNAADTVPGITSAFKKAIN